MFVDLFGLFHFTINGSTKRVDTRTKRVDTALEPVLFHLVWSDKTCPTPDKTCPRCKTLRGSLFNRCEFDSVIYLGSLECYANETSRKCNVFRVTINIV
jgi:hypothetical protein